MTVDQLEAQPNGTGPAGADALIEPAYNKGSWLDGATDLDEQDIYVDSIDTWVRVRALSAGQLAFITDQCLSMKGDVAKVDSVRMGVLKFSSAVIEPKFDENEANVISHKFGKAFSLVVGVIDEISKASEEDIAKAQRRFRPRR